MPATRPYYEPARVGPVCPFAPRGCNPRCRSFIKEKDACRILEQLGEIHAKLAASAQP